MARPARINILKQVPELNAIFKERGFPEGRVITCWPKIIGQELALSVTPERVTYHAGENCLHVQVHNADAVTVQHLAPTLIERINGFFGYAFVHKVKITQVPKALARKTLTVKHRSPPQITEDEKEEIRRIVGHIQHRQLKKILTRLGAYIFEDVRQKSAAPSASTPQGWRNLARTTWNGYVRKPIGA